MGGIRLKDLFGGAFSFLFGVKNLTCLPEAENSSLRRDIFKERFLRSRGGVGNGKNNLAVLAEKPARLFRIQQD